MELPARPEVLFHFSEDSSILQFEPQLMNLGGEAVVWAIDEEHAPNYFLPRDCPRVTFYAMAHSAKEDITRFLGQGSRRVVAIESDWYKRVCATKLYCYCLPGHSFSLQDSNAGYYISRQTVQPLRVEFMEDLIHALLAVGIELRVMPSLWWLHDAVIGSTLQFSMIRMRNAGSRHVDRIHSALMQPARDGT
jgi:hypothetical protein